MGFEKEKKSVPRSERKAKKRKAEDAIPDVPEDYAEEQLDEPVKASKKRKADIEEPKKEKKSKKTKSQEKSEDVEMTEAALVEEDKEEEGDGEAQDPDAPRLSKKERKALRKAKEAAERLANPPVEGEALVEKASAPKTDEKTEKSAKPEPRSAKPIPLDANGNPVKKKNNRNREKKRLAAAALAASGEKAPPRFIVFVGNLPFNATKETVEKHFGSVHPKSVRYLTDKVTKKGKGAAFVEFEGYDHMKTALRTMHHTEFDAGDGREKRKINVELTAGGGGNTKERKAKIVEKNEKLSEQRTRKIGEEEKQKLEKRTGVKVDSVPSAKATKEDKEGIHPSRRARVA